MGIFIWGIYTKRYTLVHMVAASFACFLQAVKGISEHKTSHGDLYLVSTHGFAYSSTAGGIRAANRVYTFQSSFHSIRSHL